MACRITLKHAGDVESSWKASWTVNTIQPDQSFQSSNILLRGQAIAENAALHEDISHVYLELAGGSRRELHKDDFGHPDIFNFFLNAFRAASTTFASEEKDILTPVKLVAPVAAGNIIRSDIVRQRMQDLEYVAKTSTFAQPLQQYDGERWTASTDLVDLFRTSIGAIQLRATPDASPTIDEAFVMLEYELQNRLPRPLTISGLRRRTLAFLEGSDMLPDTGGCATQFYTAAQSLGIDVVVLGVQGHWLQGSEYSHWRKAFIPIVFGHDADFPARIVTAVRQHPEPVEGLLTCFDSYHVAVSQAAMELGLPHEPTRAYDIATDKFKLSASEGRESFVATCVEDALDIARNQKLPWPVIIKPCRGWGSELVFRVDNIEQLESMAARMKSVSHGTEFVIEPYCDGPEVDINFAIYDGELLFWEIGDENPKSAESGSDSFHELDCVSPSELPEKEQHVLRDSIFKSLLDLGFRNGVYHCEARVDNSTCEWRNTESGSPILLLRSDACTKAPSCFLMDCNIRPPGLNSSDVVETTWGVDYWALLIAIPLRESERVKALAQPYRLGPQYFADMIFVSATFDETKQGIWDSGNVTEELMQRRPDLAQYISKALTYKRNGDKIPHPSTGTNTFVGYLNIFSRKSREHVLNVATEVRREIGNSIRIA